MEENVLRKRYVCQLVSNAFTLAFVQGAFPARPMDFILWSEICCSSSVIYHVFIPLWGRFGKKKYPATASGNVIMPSMMKSHLQPARPYTPSRFVYAADCRNPLNNWPIDPAIQKIIARLPISEGLYHDPSI